MAHEARPATSPVREVAVKPAVQTLRVQRVAHRLHPPRPLDRVGDELADGVARHSAGAPAGVDVDGVEAGGRKAGRDEGIGGLQDDRLVHVRFEVVPGERAATCQHGRRGAADPESDRAEESLRAAASHQLLQARGGVLSEICCCWVLGLVNDANATKASIIIIGIIILGLLPIF